MSNNNREQLILALNGRVADSSKAPTLLQLTGGVSYTLTADQVYANNIIEAVPNAGNAVTVTLPTAGLLVTGKKSNAKVGDIIRKKVFVNAGTTTLTVAVGVDGTLRGLAVQETGHGVNLLIRFTNVTTGSEEYDCYIMA